MSKLTIIFCNDTYFTGYLVWWYVIGSVRAKVLSGWTRWTARAMRVGLMCVITTSGVSTTVHTTKMSLSLAWASCVSLRCTFYYRVIQRCFYIILINSLDLMGCLHDSANVQQTSSKCIQNTRVNARRLLEICWKFAGRLLDRVNTLLLKIVNAFLLTHKMLCILCSCCLEVC